MCGGLNYWNICKSDVDSSEGGETSAPNPTSGDRHVIAIDMTPYDKLKSLPDAGGYLKPGVNWEQLDGLAGAMSDNESAKRMNEAREKLFQTLNRQTGAA